MSSNEFMLLKRSYRISNAGATYNSKLIVSAASLLFNGKHSQNFWANFCSKCSTCLVNCCQNRYSCILSRLSWRLKGQQVMLSTSDSTVALKKIKRRFSSFKNAAWVFISLNRFCNQVSILFLLMIVKFVVLFQTFITSWGFRFRQYFS